MLESFVVLNALGGEFVDGFQHLRDDAGLASCDEFAFRFNRSKSRSAEDSSIALPNRLLQSHQQLTGKS